MSNTVKGKIQDIINAINGSLSMNQFIKLTSSKSRGADSTAYSAGNVVCDGDWIFDSGNKLNGLYLMSVIMRIDVSSAPSGISSYKLHLYNGSTSVPLADHAAQTYLDADKSKYITTISIDTPVDKGDYLWVRMDNLNIPIECLNGIIYGRVETDGAYTPTPYATKTFTLIGVGI
jgi:hypothetical protein